MIWYEGLFEDSSCLMNHCVYAGGWAWNIGENANGSGVDDDVLVLDEENLGDNPPLARFLSLTITQCTSSHVHSLHIKKTREGKENNKWPEKSIKHGVALQKVLTGHVRLFFTPLLLLKHFSAVSDSMNDVTSLWQDLMKYCWYVTCQRLLLILYCRARRPNWCWPSIMALFGIRSLGPF